MDKWIREESDRLIERAMMLGPEDEGIDISDMEYPTQSMAELRSHMSRMRKAIDIIGAALAKEWNEEHKDEGYDDGANTWYVGRTKGKVIVDPDQFYSWLATKDADQLVKLVSATAVKVGGMSPVERETLLDETPTNDRLSIKSRPNR